MTEIMLGIVILLQFGYQIYSDLQNRKERDVLTQKLMSRDLADFKSSTEEVAAGISEAEEVEYMTMEEAGVERVLKAK